MNKNLKKKLLIGSAVFLAAVVGYSVWNIYVPRSFGVNEVVFYNAKAGIGGAQIAGDLQESGIIANSFFFNLYTVLSGNRSKLQAGFYDISPSMSVAAIVGKMAKGDVAKNKIRVVEGWDTNDLVKYFDGKNIYFKKDFLNAVKADYSEEFPFLKSKPKELGLEGYIFPDTYYITAFTMPQIFIYATLANLDKRLTPELRAQMAKDKRSIFQIITMASIIEKEVPSIKDKKIVSGILWKRLANGMPLQVDSTINFITNKNNVSATFADLKIDSKYNTYKYKGLPLGPISNPGMDSILAAVYPTKSDYWFYLSASDTGKTIFSATYEQHKVAMAKYLKNLGKK